MKTIMYLLMLTILVIMCSCTPPRHVNMFQYKNVYENTNTHNQTEIHVSACQCTAVVDSVNNVLRMFAVDSEGLVFLYDARTGKVIYVQPNKKR